MLCPLHRQERAERYKQDKELQGEKIERAKKARLEAEAKKLDQENATKRYYTLCVYPWAYLKGVQVQIDCCLPKK